MTQVLPVPFHVTENIAKEALASYCTQSHVTENSTKEVFASCCNDQCHRKCCQRH
jgi:hypothetical protein